MEENKKLIEEKLQQIQKLARELSELEKTVDGLDTDVVMQLLFTAPHADEEDTKELFGMVFGSPKELVEMQARAYKQSEQLKGLASDAVKLSEIIDSPLYDLFNVFEKVKRAKDNEPCDCPECTEERKEANKNNPNVN